MSTIQCAKPLHLDSRRDFIDKIAIVTGGGRGLGKATALSLARRGAHIVIADILSEEAQRTAEEIEAFGRRAIVVKTDITNKVQVDAMVDICLQNFERIDILVNCAGITEPLGLNDLTLEKWERVLAINLTGVFLCCKAVFPIMTKQRYGKIINIASVAGKRGGGIVGRSAYAASKGGVIAFTKAVAREGAPFGITVNAVCPGFSDTDMTKSISPEQRKMLIDMVPLGRAGKPQDVAASICFLASDEADFITGEIMDVDGGLMMD